MDLTLYLLSSVSLVFGVLGGYIGGKIRLKTFQRDLNGFEDDLAALVERFNRRQNRESMREARAAKETEKDLLERARLAAAHEGSQVARPVADPKAALRAQVKGKH